MIHATADGVVIDVRVSPRASRSRLDGVRDGALLVRLHAPPVDGAANEELVAVLAKAFGVPKRAVTIEAGARARVKRVRVAGVGADAARAVMQARDVRAEPGDGSA